MKNDPANVITDARFNKATDEALVELDTIVREVGLSKENLISLKYQLDELRALALNIRKRVAELKAAVSGKCHPTVFWNFGASGVGKSHFARNLVAELSKLEGKELLTYDRNVADAYWSNYYASKL